jgi:hypothetical protein
MAFQLTQGLGCFAESKASAWVTSRVFNSLAPALLYFPQLRNTESKNMFFDSL